MTSTATPQCRASNKRGEPCGSFALENSQFCFTHDPSLAAERKAARSKGGRARHGRTNIRTVSAGCDQTQIRTVADIMTLLEKAAADTLMLENSNARSRTLCSIAMAALKALEVGQIEERLARLEEEIVRHT